MTQSYVSRYLGRFTTNKFVFDHLLEVRSIRIAEGVQWCQSSLIAEVEGYAVIFNN